MPKILKVNNIKKTFGGLVALNDISIDVDEGSITGLIGPNGSGKTTLFNIITGFYEPDIGTVVFEDKKINGLNPNEIYNLGLARTFQNPRLFESMTMLENLLLSPPKQVGESILKAPFKRLWRDQEKKIADEIKDVTSEIGISELYNTPASDLSGGHAKMVETSKGILGGARLLLLDEPTAGIQYAAGKSVFEHIKKMREEYKLTFLVIEHRIDLLFDYCDIVYVLNMGQVIAKGTPTEVSNNTEVIKAYIGGT